MTKLELLHQAYEQASGQIVHPRATERLLYELGNMGATPDDVKCVVNYLIRCNKKSDAKYRIMFHKIMEPEFFFSVLGTALANERNRRPPPTAKQQAQTQYEQVLEPEQTSTQTLSGPKTFKDVLKSLGQ